MADDRMAATPRLRKVIDLIASNLSCESIYVVGSRARLDWMENSDIDLVVIVKGTGTFRSLLRTRNLHRRLKALGIPVDINAVSTFACSRGRNSVMLNVWHRKCGRKLIFGKDFLKKELGTNGAEPSRDSLIRTACFEVRWFLKYIELEGQVLRVDPVGLSKLIQFLKWESELSEVRIPQLSALVTALEIQIGLGAPNPKDICETLAIFVESMVDELNASSPGRFSQTASILIDRSRSSPRALLGRESPCHRITRSLCYLLRSVETGSLNRDLVFLAADSLGYLLPAEMRSQNVPPEVLWLRIRDLIRAYWDAAMNIPFGTLVIHNPFNFVLL